MSVIIPAFNYAAFLAEAVESVLRQSHTDFEVIIVDDGSTDDTAVVAQQLVQRDNRVHYVHQHNQGLSAARNAGIKKATGEFLVFLDADDVLHEQKLLAHLEHFEREPGADISYGSSRYFLSDQPDKTYATILLDEQDWMPKVSGDAPDVLPALVTNNIMPVCSAMLLRSVCDRVGGFDVSLKSLEDWDYWLRAAAAGCRFAFSEDARLAAFIRVHGGSMSKNELRMLETEYLLRKKSIPAAIARLKDQKLGRKIMEENTKLKIIRLITIAETTGIANLAFIKLCYGDSLKSVKKAITRYLKRKPASKALP